MAKTAGVKVLCMYCGEADRAEILLNLLRLYLDGRKWGSDRADADRGAGNGAGRADAADRAGKGAGPD